MPSIGPTEIIIVLVIALVVLGPKRLPDAGRSMGRALREFKDGLGADRGALDTAPEPRADRVATATATAEDA
jgi:sec-independent protein translocase protein TatA